MATGKKHMLVDSKTEGDELNKRSKPGRTGVSFDAILVEVGSPPNTTVKFYTVLPLCTDKNADGICVPYDYSKSEHAARLALNESLKAEHAAKLALDESFKEPCPVVATNSTTGPYMILPGESITVGFKGSVTCADPQSSFAYLERAGALLVTVSAMRFSYNIQTETKTKEKTIKEVKKIITVYNKGDINIGFWGMISGARPIQYADVCSACSVFKPRLLTEYRVLANTYKMPENLDFTQFDAVAIHSMTKLMKSVCTFELNNTSLLTGVESSNGLPVFACTIPELMYVEKDKDDKNVERLCFIQKTGTNPAQPTIRGPGKGLVCQAVGYIDGKDCLISMVVYPDSVYRFGVFEPERWQLVARPILRGLRAVVALSIDRDDTVNNELYIESGTERISLSGSGVFTKIDYHATFRNVGLLVSMRFAITTLSRNAKLQEDPGSEDDWVPPVDYIQDKLVRNRNFKYDTLNPYANAIYENTAFASYVNCFMLNEYTGDVSRIDEKVWDFYFVPSEPIIEDFDNKKSTSEFLKKFNYATKNELPDAIASNEDRIDATYFAIPTLTRKSLPHMVFFAVRKVTR